MDERYCAAPDRGHACRYAPADDPGDDPGEPSARTAHAGAGVVTVGGLDLPPPGDRRVAVRVTRDAQRQVRGGHPWVFESSISDVGHGAACGDLAVVFDDRRRFLAIGLYDPDSPIRVRVLHAGRPRTIDGDFWRERLGVAIDRRRPLFDRTDTTAFRVVHGENDRLPGLVVDRYGDTWVVRLDTAAWLAHLADVVDALFAATAGAGLDSPARLVLRVSRTAAASSVAPAGADGSVLCGPALGEAVPFLENGLVFEADVVRGQKTGHFLDQRDNRAEVGRRAAGARVLDVFSCTGGFTVHAAAGGARSVHAVDASPHAIEAVARHLDLNRGRPAVAAVDATSTVGDAFEVMADLAGRGASFDLVVVDPPSFASKQADVERAVSAYGRLTRLAVRLLARDGVLVQSSCSSRVPADRFHDGVLAAAEGVGRPLVDVRRTGHGVDHPIGFPQGEYLATVFARVP